MDYEKKYKEALERMKSWVRGEHPECFTEAQKAAEFIFPELQESEDEKIRKWLIDWAKAVNWSEQFTVTKEQVLAWLEKQGEKKSIWSEKDDGYKLVALSAFLNYYDEENPLRKCLINWLKSLKQRMGG